MTAMVMAAGQASAACVAPAMALPASTIGAFQNDPPALLQRHPLGAGGLVSEVRNLAVSEPTTVSQIVDLLRSANDEQRRAIGTGLGQAARMCVRNDPTVAEAIQQALLDGDSREAILAFQTVSGDVGVAATGPGAGAGPAGGGGLGGAGVGSPLGSAGSGGSALGNLTMTVPNTSGTFSAGGGSSFSFTSTPSGDGAFRPLSPSN